jgi:hypothetical protein
MLSSTLRPLTRRFSFPQRTTNHHDNPRQVDPMRRIEDHLAVKSGLDGVQVVEQACMVVPPRVIQSCTISRWYVPMSITDTVITGLSIVAPSTRFRRSRTDRTRAFEFVRFLEVFLACVRNRARLQDFLEVGN